MSTAWLAFQASIAWSKARLGMRVWFFRGSIVQGELLLLTSHLLMYDRSNVNPSDKMTGSVIRHSEIGQR